MANEILKTKSYATLYTESTWGTKPGSPTYYHLPVLDYNVWFKPQNRQANPYLGLFGRKHSKNFRGMPSGNLSCALHGYIPAGGSVSLMQYILDWGLGDLEAGETGSKGCQWAEGPGTADKEHNGLRVNAATISGSDDSGFIQASLDLMGKTEAGDGTYSVQALPDDRERIVDCEFPDSTLSIGGSAVAYKNATLQVQRGLKVEYLNSFTPSLLLSTQTLISFQCQLIKNADTYDTLRRASTVSEVAVVWTIKGLHNGTGTGGTNYTQAAITMDRCSFLDAGEQGSKEDIANQQLSYAVLKPDSSAASIAIAYTEPA